MTDIQASSSAELIHEIESGRESAFFNPLEATPLEGVAQPGVDEVRLVDWIATTQTIENETYARVHRVWTIEVDGFNRTVIDTPAVPEYESGITFVETPGLGEVAGPRGSLGNEKHKLLSARLPGERVITIATKGIGPYGDSYSLEEAGHFGIKSMAQENAKLLRAMCADAELVLAGCSMGSVINEKMSTYFSEGLNIVGLIPHEPAIVLPKNVIEAMLIKFVPALELDIGRRLAGRAFKPRQLGTLLMTLAGSKPSKEDVLAMSEQGLSLIRGTKEGVVRALIERGLQHAVIAGMADPVAAHADWEQRARRFPDAVTLNSYKSGHARAIDPKSMHAVANVAKQIVLVAA